MSGSQARGLSRQLPMDSILGEAHNQAVSRADDPTLTERGLTIKNITLGTVNYMSPEQWLECWSMNAAICSHSE